VRSLQTRKHWPVLARPLASCAAACSFGDALPTCLPAAAFLPKSLWYGQLYQSMVDEHPHCFTCTVVCGPMQARWSCSVLHSTQLC
jgi:hypothetical protein